MGIKVDRTKKGRRNTYISAPRKNIAGEKSPSGEPLSFAGGAIRRILTDVLMALGAVVAMLGIGIGSLQLYDIATTSDFFATQQVEVEGNVRLTKEMVMRLAQLRLGDNSLAVSITRMEQALLVTPWVEEVSIKRMLPDRFIISLKERMPSFWIHKDGTLYYANESGQVIAPVESTNFLALPTLIVEDGTEEDLLQLPMYIKDLQSGELPVDFGVISGMTLSTMHGMEIYLEDREMRLSIATKEWKRNLKRMSLTLEDLAQRRELGIVREVRVSDESVWVIQSKRHS